MQMHELPFMSAGPNGTLEILKLIPLVMRDIVEIPKLRKRGTGGRDEGGGTGASFAFRGIDDALNYISPALIKHSVTPSTQLLQVSHSSMNTIDKYNNPKVMNRTEVVLAVTLMAPDGSWVRNVCGGMATDYNDGTSSNKAHSAAEKYCLFLGLMVPVERVALEDQDADEQQGDPDKAPAYVERAQDADRPIGKPGDDKSEELFQTALAAGKRAYGEGNIDLLRAMAQRAQNNTKFTDEQRNTLIKSFRDFAQKIVKSRSTEGQGSKGTQPPASKPAAKSNAKKEEPKGNS